MPSTMKARDIRACDSCKKPIAPIFYRVTVEIGAFQADAVNRLMGTTQILGGISNPGAMTIANVMTGDEALVKLDTFEAPALLCPTCFNENVVLNEVPGLASDGVNAARKARGE